MFKLKESNVDRKALEETTPVTNKTVPWYKDAGLRQLNLMLFFLLLSEFTQGYDSSLINNVQQLDVWQNGQSAHGRTKDLGFNGCIEFHHPHGSLLGVM